MDFPHINSDKVSLLADFEAADFVVETQGLGAVDSRHFQDGFRGDNGRVLGCAFVDDCCELHLLEEIACVVAWGPIGS